MGLATMHSATELQRNCDRYLQRLLENSEVELFFSISSSMQESLMCITEAQ